MSEKEHHKHSSSNSKEPINLRRYYPIAYRSILRQSIIWILGLIILMLVITAVDSFGPSDQTMVDQVFFFFQTSLLLLGITLVIGKLVYEFLYFQLYYYGIELEHLVISRGLFFKTRSSIPIARLSDVYIERLPLDLPFFLYNLHFTSTSPAEHGPVEGLTYENAFQFQNYLLALANTTVNQVNNEAAKETLDTVKVTKDPSLFDKSPANVDPPISTPENLPDQHHLTSKIQNKNTLNNTAIPVPATEKKELKIEKLPANEPTIVADTSVSNKIIDELHHTQEELKKTREELTHAEEVLEKTRETIEHRTK